MDQFHMLDLKDVKEKTMSKIGSISRKKSEADIPLSRILKINNFTLIFLLHILLFLFCD